jgi:hypothetical protein
MMAGTAPLPAARRGVGLPPISSRSLAIVRWPCASVVSAWALDGSTRVNALVAVRPSPQPRRNLGLTRLWLLKLTLFGIWLPRSRTDAMLRPCAQITALCLLPLPLQGQTDASGFLNRHRRMAAQLGRRRDLLGNAQRRNDCSYIGRPRPPVSDMDRPGGTSLNGGQDLEAQLRQGCEPPAESQRSAWMALRGQVRPTLGHLHSEVLLGGGKRKPRRAVRHRERHHSLVRASLNGEPSAAREMRAKVVTVGLGRCDAARTVGEGYREPDTLIWHQRRRLSPSESIRLGQHNE